jgi:serine/threonine protein kinase
MDGSLVGGRYRLLESHALGGMASVWRAADEQTGDIVAIKRLHPHLTADPGAKERLLREAAAMEIVRHPNVVGIRGVIADDEPVLVMDFVEGSSLADLLAEGRVFAKAEALAIAAAGADGLGAAHEQGIVHRDVKPSNILVGDDGVVRVFDFGVAVGLDDETALTVEGGVIGTLRYLAPERLAGEPATPATDVWGLGAVLFELLTGKAAFPALTLTERIDDASSGVDRPPGLDDDVWTIVDRSLAVDPLDRYPTGGALAAALHGLDGVPEPANASTDPSALTEVFVVPVVEGEAEATQAPSAEPALLAGPASVAGRSMILPSIDERARPAWAAAGVLAATVLIAFVAMASGGRSGDRQAPPAFTALPTSEIVDGTILPVVAEPTPTAQPDTPAPPHETKKKGKGPRKP